MQLQAEHMKLYEFFGNIERDLDKDDRAPDNLKLEKEQELSDNLFWFILDHTDLHKEFFMPIAKKLKKIYDSKSKKDDLHDWKVWMPMVNKGCIQFYKKHQMIEDPNDVFNKNLRIDICKRLTDHYHQDIVKDEHKLGH